MRYLTTLLALCLGLGLAACDNTKKQTGKKKPAADGNDGDSEDAKPEDDGGKPTGNGDGPETNGGGEGGEKPPANRPDPPDLVDLGVVTVETKPLHVKGLRHDFWFTASLRIIRADGTTADINWPAKGETVDVPEVCGGEAVTIKIQAVSDGTTFDPSNPQCFVGKSEADKKGVNVGFEDDCDSLAADKIDDAVAQLKCDDATLTVETLRLDESIDVASWTR